MTAMAVNLEFRVPISARAAQCVTPELTARWSLQLEAIIAADLDPLLDEPVVWTTTP